MYDSVSGMNGINFEDSIVFISDPKTIHSLYFEKYKGFIQILSLAKNVVFSIESYIAKANCPLSLSRIFSL